MLERARRVPGVEAVALSDTLPPDRQSNADVFTMQGSAVNRGESNSAVSVAIVSAEYFQTMHIPLAQGALLYNAG